MHKGSGYIALGGERLHYISIGIGRRLLLAFHGYNNDAQLFTPIANYLGNEYTVISIDLPHHGKSDWPGDKQLDINQLRLLADTFKEDHGVDKLSLLGYSIGGRVCLKIAELMPESIDTILLAAPDGLVFNPFYYFLTRTLSGGSVFRSFLKNPHRYAPLINLLRKTKWLDEPRYKFAMQYLQTAETRDFLYRVWPCLCQLIPDSNKLRKVIKQYAVPVHVFMGRHDRVIPVAHAEKFKKQLDTVQLHILEKGHRLLDAETLPVMAKCLLA